MKKLSMLTATLLIAGCTSTPPKDSQAVSMYTGNKSPETAYRVIGVAKVSKYNVIGMARQPETVHDLMKKQAASMGGDGLINVSDNQDSIEANVIAFQKILI